MGSPTPVSSIWGQLKLRARIEERKRRNPMEGVWSKP